MLFSCNLGISSSSGFRVFLLSLLEFGSTYVCFTFYFVAIIYSALRWKRGFFTLIVAVLTEFGSVNAFYGVIHVMETQILGTRAFVVILYEILLAPLSFVKFLLVILIYILFYALLFLSI